MSKFLAQISQVGPNLYLIDEVSRRIDPGFGGGLPAPIDPDYGFGTLPHPDHGLPGYGHPDAGLPWAPVRPGHDLPNAPVRPGNALPMPPVKPSVPIVLPPNVWPPRLPPEVDNSLPGGPGHVSPPIYLPPDPDVGIEAPIFLPTLPPGTALLIALPTATPKAGTPPGAKPAILYQGAGTKPVLVYVMASASPK